MYMGHRTVNRRPTYELTSHMYTRGFLFDKYYRSLTGSYRLQYLYHISSYLKMYHY